jgi:hypothetical protein
MFKHDRNLLSNRWDGVWRAPINLRLEFGDDQLFPLPSRAIPTSAQSHVVPKCKSRGQTFSGGPPVMTSSPRHRRQSNISWRVP